MPTVAAAGGTPEIVGARLPEDTVIWKAGSDTVALPSVTLILMFEYVPAADDGGVP